MFGKLRDKLKQAVQKFSKKAEEETLPAEEPEETPQEPAQEPKEPEEPVQDAVEDDAEIREEPEVQRTTREERPGKKVTEDKPEKPQEAKPVEEQSHPAHDRPEEPAQPEVEQSRGFFQRVRETLTKKQLSEEKFDELFWELELAMLENNVAVEVIEKIKHDLKDELTSGKVTRTGVNEMILAKLRESVAELFPAEPPDLVRQIREGEKPFRICIIGVNGSGKTTTLAKLVRLFQENNLSVVVAASDTFRAAAIDQLQEHTDKLGVKLISQGYEADPAAVAFDAIEHAKSRGLDVVLIDTAGRLHSNTNLMAELEKVVRVAKPDMKIFVGESITGNDCVEQAKVFDSLVGIDGIILTKADVDEKGGAAISVSYVTGKPILYLGTGQKYEDLEKFEKEKVLEATGL